jgi:hypothetical protein
MGLCSVPSGRRLSAAIPPVWRVLFPGRASRQSFGQNSLFCLLRKYTVGTSHGRHKRGLFHHKAVTICQSAINGSSYVFTPGQCALWRMEATVAATQPSCVPSPIAHTGDWINSPPHGHVICKGPCPWTSSILWVGFALAYRISKNGAHPSTSRAVFQMAQGCAAQNPWHLLNV